MVRRYDIVNFLFEAAYDEVLDRCGCTPYYHWGVVDLPTILEQRPFCKVSSVTYKDINKIENTCVCLSILNSSIETCSKNKASGSR